MAMGCNLIIEKVKLITQNRIRAFGYMNYGGNYNNRVVFEIDSVGEICNQVSGHFMEAVLPQTTEDFRRIFQLDKYPLHTFTHEKLVAAVNPDKPIVLYYSY